MSFLGRLLGTHPPRVPAGGRAFVSEQGEMLDRWCVRVAMPGEDMNPARKQISPTFDLQMTAERYLDWVNGGAKFQYPEGEA